MERNKTNENSLKLRTCDCRKLNYLSINLPCFLRRFSFERRKTKTKVITLTNHNSREQSSEPIRAEANTCSRRQARENVCRQVTIGFVFTSDWLRKWSEILFSQSQSVAMQNQSDHEITFDTQLKNRSKIHQILK